MTEIKKKLGINQLIVLAGVTAQLGNTFGAIFEDGKVDWTDLTSVGSLFSVLKDLNEIEFGAVLPELADLDKDEISQLNAVFDAKFKIANTTIEHNVERGLLILFKSYEAIKFFRGLI